MPSTRYFDLIGQLELRMGITKADSTFLFYAKTLGVSYDVTLTLGRQHLYVTKNEIKEQTVKFKNEKVPVEKIEFADQYCESLLKILGANIAESIDYSDYEKATYIHDMNRPVDAGLKNKFSVVLDSGTLEHIFDYKCAVKNCMEMIKTGGHFIGITPVNNLMGHGFYQFTPELFYAVFSKQNGFEMVKMLIGTATSDGNIENWYEVADPAVIKERLHLVNNKPTYIYFVAKKIDSVEVFKQIPFQSDYVNAWKAHDVIYNDAPTNESKAKLFYRKNTPMFIKNFIYKVRTSFKKKQIVTGDLGKIDPRHFKKTEI
jgi:SAM-dependent methyltransferase